MDSIVSAFESRRAFQHSTPANDGQILEAESMLGLKFADDYREYLRVFGSASYYGHELTGLYPHESINVVDVTDSLRPLYPDVPAKWYVIEEMHIDGLVMWQDTDGVIYQAIPGVLPTKVADSLAEYVRMDESAK